MNKIITTLVLAAAGLLSPMVSRADVIFQEQFNYTNGPIVVTGTNVVGGTMVTNWIRFSGTANPSDLIVNSNRLEVSTTGAGLPTPNRQDDCGRLFSITNGCPYTNGQQFVYVSFIVNFTNLPTANGAYFGMFKNGAATSTFYQGKIWALAGSPAQTTNNFAALPNTYRLGVSASGSGSPSKTYAMDLALNTPYQVVLFWDPVNDYALSLWVNPISSSDQKVESNDSFTPSSSNIANDYAFRQATGFGGFLTVSNLVVATSFNEAATNVWATNAVAPQIAYQPLGTTNFLNAAVQISAVAAGQGQASLNYQWQVSTSPANTSPVNISNSNGNTNVFSVPTASVGTNYYTLVVTTPYGLSATSSVAAVAIRIPAAAPVFSVQPGSQNTYRGQNVTFSTTVVSPGNISYTWYSNNVVVSTTQSPVGQSDSGQTSTFTLNNVQTNFSATYKVAVTNDTVPNGIVSTNAVLTVSNPPSVSIAYLRSLVDSAYQPTDGTTPYQVTGIVTIYTNTTSGNTSGYFLQDATAGINIFATFGSTFRPALGDSVTFVGVLSYFSTTGLELYADTVNRPYTSYTDTSSGNALPTPRLIPFNPTNTYGFDYVNTNLAGSLVTLTNVYFGTNAGVVLSTTNYAAIVTNKDGVPFKVQFFGVNLDTAGQTLPPFASSVTGIFYGGNPNFSVAVSKFSDIVVAPPAADVSVLKTGPGYVFAGSNLTYTITVSNAGPAAATSTVVTDSLPVGVTFVSATGGGANNSGVVTWSVGTLASGATASVTVTVTAPTSGSVTNKASAGSTAPEANPADNTSSMVITSVAPIPVAGPIVISGGNPTISWNVAAGPTYSVLWSTNLAGPYTSIGSGLTSSPFQDTLHPTQPIGFYKITSP